VGGLLWGGGLEGSIVIRIGLVAACVAALIGALVRAGCNWESHFVVCVVM
jgi:hypothetical protein